MTAPDAYHQLLACLKRTHSLGTIAALLGWDEQVNLPRLSADLRAEQLATLAELQQAAATDPRIDECLSALEAAPDSLDGDQRVVIAKARLDYTRASRLSEAFMAEKARTASEAYHAWAAARENDDFHAFAPFLQKHLDLARQEAKLQGWGDRAYDYAIDRHDPGVNASILTRLFSELEAGLLPLVRELEGKSAPSDTNPFSGFPIEDQRLFIETVTRQMGFDFDRGRFDVSLHPFCEGSGADVRMTTRFDVDNPLDALFSAIHETGHGLYEQGLPLALQGTPLGQAVGMGVHESQSRLWENQVARGRAFWQCFEPQFRKRFPKQLAQIDSRTFYRSLNAIRPTLIRVDADEVHYNLHILLRFQLEQRLFTGTLAVQDLPGAWKDLSQSLLGLTPPNDRLGVLQDVHWAGGAFGYFPSYCLGNMIAAQLWFTLLAQIPDLENDFARGDFSRLLAWLRTNIHGQGRRFDTLELVERVTGQVLSPQPLLRYLRDRYLSIFN